MMDTRNACDKRDPHEGAFVETALTASEIAEAAKFEERENSVEFHECDFLATTFNQTSSK